jgi:pimeloyl-ACP methyl ester carboxylesterase
LRDEIDGFQASRVDTLPDLAWFTEFMKRLWTDEALSRSPAEVQDFVLSMIRYPPSIAGLHKQAGAIAAHDAFDRLPDLQPPTLVLTGTEDLLIDPLNSMILADRIPNAELRSFAGLRHAFHLEQPTIVNSVIIDFIERQARRAPR